MIMMPFTLEMEFEWAGERELEHPPTPPHPRFILQVLKGADFCCYDVQALLWDNEGKVRKTWKDRDKEL